MKPMKFFGGALFVAAFFARPTVLGVDYAPISLVLSLVVVVLFSVMFGFKIKRRHIMIAASVAILWGFWAVHSMVNGNSNGWPITQAILIIGTTFSFALVLSNRLIQYYFFRFLVIWIIFQCISYTISIAPAAILGWQTLTVFKLNLVSAYTQTGHFIFPFTSVYGTYPFLGENIIRLAAGFREPGIAQAFIIWAYFTLPLVSLDKGWIKVVLLIGLLGTVSSVALPLFLFSYIVFNFGVNTKSKFTIPRIGWRTIIGAALVLPIVAYISYHLPDFGLKAKLAGVSGSSRLEMILNGVTLLSENPLGVGIYNSSGAVNILALSAQIGIPGLLLLFIMYWNSVAIDRFHLRKLVLVGVFFITWLASQPLHDAALIYVLLLQDPEPIVRRHTYLLRPAQHIRHHFIAGKMPTPEAPVP